MDLPSFKVEIERSLPSSGGMGSSAASSVAGAIAAFLLLGKTPEDRNNSTIGS